MFRKALSVTAVIPIAAVLSLLLTTGAVRAADDEEKARIVETKGLLKEMKEIHRDHEAIPAGPLLERAVVLHNELETDSWRKKVREQVCKVLRDKDVEKDRLEAIDALLALDESKGAYEHLRELLPTSKAEEVDAVRLKAIEGVGKLAQDPAIPRLIELMKKSKNIEARKRAITALGNYGNSKRRVLVLEEMLDVLRLLKPSRSPGKRVSPEARKRWSDFSRPLVSSLNSLTGRNESSADIWLDLHKRYKKNLRILFQESED